MLGWLLPWAKLAPHAEERLHGELVFFESGSDIDGAATGIE